MRDPFAIPFAELPNELIVFPLPGALLLPNGRLPPRLARLPPGR